MAAPDAPDGLGERGSALWAALGRDVNTADGVLALEACRAADRLDELDSIIQGKGVLGLMQFRLQLDEVLAEPAATVTVKFDSALGEARQQQNNLRQMLITLAAASPANADPKPQQKTGGSTVDEFTARRRGRGA